MLLKNKFFHVVILACFSSLSCDNIKSLDSVLSESCYWDIHEVGSIHPINSCYKFDKSGKCGYYYYYYYEKGKRTKEVFKFNDGDVVVPDVWNYANDSLFIRGNKYSVINYNNDSVALGVDGVKTMILYKNCETKKR